MVGVQMSNKTVKDYYMSLADHFCNESIEPIEECPDCAWFLEVNGTKIFLDSDHEVRDVKIGRICVEELP